MSPQDSAALSFPCAFPIKVMGAAIPEFEQRVVEIITRHAPDTPPNAFRRRASKGARYLAITVVIQAHSRAQLDALYGELTTCELVAMAL